MPNPCAGRPVERLVPVGLDAAPRRPSGAARPRRRCSTTASRCRSRSPASASRARRSRRLLGAGGAAGEPARPRQRLIADRPPRATRLDTGTAAPRGRRPGPGRPCAEPAGATPSRRSARSRWSQDSRAAGARDRPEGARGPLRRARRPPGPPAPPPGHGPRRSPPTPRAYRERSSPRPARSTGRPPPSPRPWANATVRAPGATSWPPRATSTRSAPSSSRHRPRPSR